MIDETDQLLTADDACKMLGISRQTLDRLRARGDLPTLRRGSGPKAPLRFRLADVRAVIRPDRNAASHAERGRS